MALKGKGETIFMFILFLFIGIYLVGKFVVPDATGSFEFTIPENVDAVTFNGLKYVIVGAFAWAALKLATKFGQTMTRKDFMTLLVIGAISVLAFWYLFQPILGAAGINEITWKTGQMIGVLG